MTTTPAHNPSEGLLGDFEDPRPVRDGAAFVVDVEGFEGPLDMLLALARTNKLDLAKISMLELAQQYLDFIGEVRKLRLELAADYLVMAAWLTFLKSKLLLPDENDEDEPSGEELAAHLTFRLQRLQAMREAAARLMTGKRLGRDVFARGAPEGIRLNKSSSFSADILDLLKAYSERRQRTGVRSIQFKARPTVSIKEARERLEAVLEISLDWTPIDGLLGQYLSDPKLRRSAAASSLGASLEMAREGMLELKQSRAFAPLYVRRRESED